MWQALATTLTLVIAGLDPAIHALQQALL